MQFHKEILMQLQKPVKMYNLNSPNAHTKSAQMNKCNKYAIMYLGLLFTYAHIATLNCFKDLSFVSTRMHIFLPYSVILRIELKDK